MTSATPVRLRTSGMWRRVVWWMTTNIYDEYLPYHFTLKEDKIYSSIYRTPWHHTQRTGLNIRSGEDLSSHT